MADFILLNHKFSTTPDQDNYAVLAVIFGQIRKREVNKFYDKYRSNYPTIDNWMQDIVLKINEPLRNATHEAVDFLRSKGIYTISEDMFFRDSFTQRYIDNAINKITEQLCDIDEKARADREYRAIRKETRGRAAGIGVGIGGYVKASMQAGAINLATGLGHSLVNSVGNAATTASASSKMNGIIREESTIISFCKVIDMSIYDMMIYTAQIFNRETNFKCKIISEQDEVKSDAILESLDHLSGVQRKDALIQALQLNILSEAAYKYIVEHYPEEAHNADIMATHFGIDVSGPFCERIVGRFTSLRRKHAQFNLGTFTPYTDLREIYSEYDQVMKQIEETGWEDEVVAKRLPELASIQDLIGNLHHKCFNCDFADREEVVKCASELEAFYKEIRTLELNNEFVYSQAKIDSSKYENLNLYHFEVLYESLEKARKVQSDTEIVDVIQDLLSKGFASTLTDKFVLAGKNSEFDKRAKQVDKYLPLNPGEKIWCVVYLRMNQGFAFTNQRVMMFDHMLVKHHTCLPIEETAPFEVVADTYAKLQNNVDWRRSDFKVQLADTGELVVQTLMLLNAILNIVKFNCQTVMTSQNVKVEAEKKQDENVEKYIRDNYSLATKVQAIAKYRELTGADLKVAKDRVDEIFATSSSSVAIEKEEHEVGNKSETIFCPFCGNKILRAAKFCNYCGKENNYRK